MVLQERKSAMTAISSNSVNSETAALSSASNWASGSGFIAISQGHLNIWETCQRKYRYKYLEELSLAELQNQSNLVLGSQFHLLMQQRELGLDVTALASGDKHLQAWLTNFCQQPPQMIAGDRLCEHRRTYVIDIDVIDIDIDGVDRNPVPEPSGDAPSQTWLDHNHDRDRHQGYFVLTAIYDLLILGDRQAQILDWKTHQRAIAAHSLQQNWQTRLYLYLLATTTSYAPDQLTMTYWFANTGESVVISYSQAEHERTERKLRQILTEMYQAHSYPKLPDHSAACRHCEFQDRCDRGAALERQLDALNKVANIESIPEIAIL